VADVPIIGCTPTSVGLIVWAIAGPVAASISAPAIIIMRFMVFTLGLYRMAAQHRMPVTGSARHGWRPRAVRAIRPANRGVTPADPNAYRTNILWVSAAASSGFRTSASPPSSTR
jgi:hypothetical protein